MIVTGDAYLTKEIAQIAAKSVQQSLEQLVDATRGELIVESNTNQSVTANADTFNVCTNNYLPTSNLNDKIFVNVLLSTPIPGLVDSKGGIPRFRSEIGVFAGTSTAIHASVLKGGFGEYQSEKGFVAGIDANAMVGFGLDGVLNKSGDGLIFLQFGWRQDAPNTTQLFQNVPSPYVNSLISMIPGRTGINFRLRLPFYLLPGDLLVAGPILALVAPKTLQRMAVASVNGGLIPWQSGIATPIGRFQFVFGREVGVTLYGLTKTNDALFITDQNNKTALVTYQSTKFDFPVLEYTPLRSYSQDQASTLKLQLGFGVDIPKLSQVIVENTYNPLLLKPIWNFNARILFNWRHYF
jgi:hypothetical protein